MTLQIPNGCTLTTGLLDVLGREIVMGHFDHGAFPTEAELSSRYGVSRPVVREAIKMLVAKSIIQVRARQGIRIESRACWNCLDTDVLRWLLKLSPSKRVLHQLHEVRVAIEPEATALAAASAGTEWLDSMAEALARLAEDDIDSTEASVDFHTAVLRASGNPFFAQFENAVVALLRGAAKLTGTAEDRAESVSGHAAVFRSILKRDREEAREAMRRVVLHHARCLQPVR